MADWNALLPAAPAASSNILSDPMKAIGLLNALNQNTLQQQEISSRSGIENLYKGAINPDGTPDNALLMSRLPTLGVKSIEGASALQGQQIQRNTQQEQLLKIGETSRAITNTVVGSLNPNATPDELTRALTIARRNFDPNVLPSSTINQTISDFRNASPEDRSRMITDAQRQSVGAAPLSDTQETTSPTGQRGLRSRGGIIEDTAPITGAPKLQYGTVPTSLPAGAEKSVGILQEHLARAGNFGQDIFPWQQALEKLKALGPGGTGPGSKGRQEFESFVYSASPAIAQMMGVNPEKVKNYAEAEKYLTNATQQRANSFGAHTDLGLSTALTGSPSVHINDLAATDVTRAAIALRRMEHVQTLANSNDPANYTANAAKFAASQHPAAYMMDVMTPEQISRLNTTLKGPERDKFNKSLALAIKYGVVSPPSGGNAP